MKFVFGGSFQGKLDFVAEQLVQEGKIPQKAQISALTAEGEICAWEDFFAKPVIHHLEQAIWKNCWAAIPTSGSSWMKWEAALCHWMPISAAGGKRWAGSAVCFLRRPRMFIGCCAASPGA